MPIFLMIVKPFPSSGDKVVGGSVAVLSSADFTEVTSWLLLFSAAVYNRREFYGKKFSFLIVTSM